MSNDNRFQHAEHPTPILVTEVREASRLGYALTSDPQTVPVDPSRVVHRTNPDGSRGPVVAVLAPGVPLSRVSRQIGAALRAQTEGKWVRRSDVVNRIQAVERLDVGPETFDRWREIDTFPKPFSKSGAREVRWDLRELRAWVAERDRWLSPRAQRLRKRS